MELRTYDFSGDEPSFGPLGIAMVVPEPGALGLAAVAMLALGLRFRRQGPDDLPVIDLRSLSTSRPTAGCEPHPRAG
jgi:hypothetical protein